MRKTLAESGWSSSDATWGEIEDYSRNDTLYLDKDGVHPRCSLRRVWELFRSIGIRVVWVRYSKSRRGWHVVIRVNRGLDALVIVALQSVLGSDPKREAFNLARVMAGYNKNGAKRWNILYRRKIEPE